MGESCLTEQGVYYVVICLWQRAANHHTNSSHTQTASGGTKQKEDKYPIHHITVTIHSLIPRKKSRRQASLP